MWAVNRTGFRGPGLRKGETSTRLCDMGNQNSRFQSEAAPDGLIVMRKPANKRLIIVAAAEPWNPVLFIAFFKTIAK